MSASFSPDNMPARPLPPVPAGPAPRPSLSESVARLGHGRHSELHPNLSEQVLSDTLKGTQPLIVEPEAGPQVREAAKYLRILELLGNQKGIKDPELLEASKRLGQGLAAHLPDLLYQCKASNPAAIQVGLVKLFESKLENVPKISLASFGLRVIVLPLVRSLDNGADVAKEMVEKEIQGGKMDDRSITYRALIAANIICEHQKTLNPEGVKPLPQPQGVSTTSDFARFFLERVNVNQEDMSSPSMRQQREVFRKQIIEKVALFLNEGSAKDFRSQEQSQHVYGSSLNGVSLYYSSARTPAGTTIQVGEYKGGYTGQELNYQINIKQPGRTENEILIKHLDANRLLEGDLSQLVPISERLSKLSNLELVALYRQIQSDRDACSIDGNHRPECLVSGGKPSILFHLMVSELSSRSDEVGRLLGSRLRSIAREAVNIDVNILNKFGQEIIDYRKSRSISFLNSMLLGIRHVTLGVNKSKEFAIKTLNEVCPRSGYTVSDAAASLIEAMEERRKLLM